MADVVATLTLLNSRVEGHGRGRVVKEYEITFDTGADYPAGGIPIDFQGAENPNNIERAKFARVPDGFEVINTALAEVANITPGVLFTDWTLRLSEGAAEENDTDFSGEKVRIRLSGPAI